MEKIFPDNPRLIAKPVPGLEEIGAGLFATDHFAPGEVVLRLDWSDTDRAEIVHWDDTDVEHQARSTAVAPQWYFYVCDDHPFWFLNHSCNPNVAYRDWAAAEDDTVVSLVALREIRPGDQVTIDYSTMTTSDDGEEEGVPWTMECLCGEGDCRRVLTDFTSLPRGLQIQMLLRREPVGGTVPAFIVNESPELVRELKRAAPDLAEGLMTALEKQMSLAEYFDEVYEWDEDAES
ncbi:MAG TPA: SET domain-containing protein [Blastocatellia bacterium]|nr:SET domain-containing protein [Blastocatellia bacterium]